MLVIREFFSRALGIIIYLAGFSAVVLAINSLDSSIASTKQSYANDSAYSEASLEVSDEATVTKEELITTLTRCPNRDLLIRDDRSNYVLKISSGYRKENIITIEKYGINKSDKTSKTINFGRDRWNLEQLDLDKYIQSEKFRMHEVTYADGSLKSIVYYGE